MYSVIIAKALSSLLVLAGWGGVANEQQAEALFEKNRLWFEYVVRQVANSREIEKVYLPEDFSDETNKSKLGAEDQRIYASIQAGMKQAFVSRIDVVGSDIKEAANFIMEMNLTYPGGISILEVSPGYSVQQIVPVYYKCRPIVGEQWYICQVD